MKSFAKTALALIAVCSLSQAGTVQASPLTSMIGDSAQAVTTSDHVVQVGFDIIGLDTSGVNIDAIEDATILDAMSGVDHLDMAQKVYDATNTLYPQIAPQINSAGGIPWSKKNAAKNAVEQAVEGVLGHPMGNPPTPTWWDQHPELEAVQQRVDDAVAAATTEALNN